MRPDCRPVSASAAAFYGYKVCLNPDVKYTRAVAASSVLPTTFDLLWAQALNHYESKEVTHFAMLHDDVVPCENWLGILVEEMTKHDADIVSVVVPMKNPSGLTSTALDTTGDPWNPQQLTLREIYEYPETFTHPSILLNSGCWLANLSKPWVRRTTDDGSLAVSFRQLNKVVRGYDGRFEPRQRSEDWEFSRDVRRFGGERLYATRRVRCYHEQPQWTNAEVWGVERVPVDGGQQTDMSGVSTISENK